MYTIRQTEGPVATYALRDDDADSTLELAPTRGGMVTRLRIRGREVLYLDPATLNDRSKSVRGGIPVLFPIAGRLRGDAYRVGETTYAMKQHGFARNMAWDVVECAGGADARVTLALASTAETRAVFPWDFEVRIRYVLAGATLAVEQSYRNAGATPMPLHAGFHPYFRVADGAKARATITTDATRAFDNRTGTTGAFAGFDLTQPEVDLHLLDHRARTTELATGDGVVVRLALGPSFGTVVVWTLAGKDFVCVEPWTAPGDALNTGVGVIHVPPGAHHDARFAITAE